MKKVASVVDTTIIKFNLIPFTFNKLEYKDLNELELMINGQDESRLDFFKPHQFEIQTLKKVYADPAFLMMGAFDDSKLVGYFFLRFFSNRKCFVGRLIDEQYEGKGIGRVMNDIMYNIAWSSGFRCLSTISRNNSQVLRSHSNNKSMKILKELPNDYLLIEFVNPN